MDFSKNPFTLTRAGGGEIRARSVIVATGASANWLGLESEERFKNRGVSACAVCDGALPRFRDKELVVVGGGDSAVEEATYLTKFASRVHLIHRRDELRASKIMAKRAYDSEKIEIHYHSKLVEVLGDDTDGVTGVRLQTTTESGEETHIKRSWCISCNWPYAEHSISERAVGTNLQEICCLAKPFPYINEH